MDYLESFSPGKHYIAWPEGRFLSIRFACGQKEVEANHIKANAAYGLSTLFVTGCTVMDLSVATVWPISVRINNPRPGTKGTLS